MQSLPKLLFEKKQWKFSPPSFIPFKKSAKKYSLKIIWNGMKNENEIFLNLSQWCSVGHFSKTLLNFKIKSEQKTKKSHPNPPSNHLLRTFKVWKIYIFGCHFIKVFLKVLEQQQRHLSPKKSQAKLCVISLKKRKKNFSFFVLTRASNKNKTLPLTTILYYKS